MVKIRIKDYVPYAYTYDEGQIIFELIKPRMDLGEQVALSFDGLKAVPSSFLNAAVLQLFDLFSLEDIRSQLRIENSTDYINDMIRRGFATAEQRDASKAKL